MSTEQILNTIKKSKAEKVKIAITDIDGILRGKVINKKKFLSIVEGGFGFCDVVFGWDASDELYDNVELTGWHTGFQIPMRKSISLRFVVYHGTITFLFS